MPERSKGTKEKEGEKMIENLSLQNPLIGTYMGASLLVVIIGFTLWYEYKERPIIEKIGFIFAALIVAAVLILGGWLIATYAQPPPESGLLNLA